MTPTRRTSSRSVRAASVVLLLLAAACSNSGRALPPAGPSQTQSIVTTTVPSTTTIASGGDTSSDARDTSADGADGESTEAVDGSLTIAPLTTDASEATTDTLASGASSATATGVSDGPLPSAAGPLSLTVPWTNAGQIPVQYTCKGAGTSPAISWANVMPTSTQVAIVLTDPDAGDFVHWVIWGIPPTVSSLPAGISPTTYLQATSSAGNIGYTAPCPPSGSHTYVMTLYELTSDVTLPSGSAAKDVIAQLDQDVIDSVVITGQAGS